MGLKHFLRITDMTRDEFISLIDHAVRLKEQTFNGICPQPFVRQTGGLVFHKPSLRTRVSFEVGLHQLGAKGMFLTDQEIQLGVRETIADAAQVLSRYLDLIIIRTFKQSDIDEFAKYSRSPVINALTDLLHPCQIFCDLLTVKEKLGTIENIKVAYLGDGNNITRSWINAARLLGIDLWVATAPTTHPGEEFLKEAKNGMIGSVTVTDDAIAAVNGANVIYTDVWASMGEKDKAKERQALLSTFQVNSTLLKHADPNCIVMHCLPAERGKEITDEVMDGPQSVCIDQAENRLHGQKSIMMWCMGKI